MPLTADADPGFEGLRARDLVVRYGGLTAVDGVSLHAPLARITGLIGPNGAGKTSLFNACSGLIKPARGGVQLFGEEVTDLSVQARARKGLGRTFQRIELFDSLSVHENIAMGREAAMAGSQPLRHLFSSRSESEAIRQRTEEAVVLCGIESIVDKEAASLSTGQRRLVELARVIAGEYRILLLDEPSSGLDKNETEQFAGVLRQLVGHRGIGVLLVEHDMALVMSVTTYIHVVDFGQPLFEGTPHEVASSELVRSAYLGSEATEVPA